MPNADLRLNQITEKDTGKVFQLENATPTFDSVAAMKSATWLTVGQSARTLGYYTPGDGGGNDYQIVAAGTGTDDGGSFIDLSGSGLQAKGLFADGVPKSKQFGAAKTNPARIQAFLDYIADGSGFMSEGEFDAPATGWRVSSATVLRGSKRKTILNQPVAGTDVTVFYSDDSGVDNVELRNMTLRGPYYQSSSGGYDANPVQSTSASNGVQIRGREYQNRKGIAPAGLSSNIVIEELHVSGFGEDAIQVDNADHVRVRHNTLKRCGRGGIRFYGCYDAKAYKNKISKMFPGEALNNGNRMYGITFTRVYQSPLSDYRPSENCTASHNTIRDIPYWKGLDTHGGKSIKFLFNSVRECHIGIGIDKGGFDAAQGIAPPSDIWCVGNELVRTNSDDPAEGDNGEAGAGIFCVAHDQTDAQVGRVAIVSKNVLRGWGENSRFGALVYSNWVDVESSDNHIESSRRAAVCLRERVSGIFGNDTISNVRQSSLGIQDGYAVESGAVSGILKRSIFRNEEATTLRAITLANPASGKGLKVDADHIFEDVNSGGIINVDNPFNDQFGLWTAKLKAAGRINTDGSISGSRGIKSVTKTATGKYSVVVDEPAQAASSLWPVACPRGGPSAVTIQADTPSADTVSIVVRDANANLVDGSFMIHIFGY